VKGELDHDTTGYLREIIDQELKEDPHVLILDFSELAYMDSGGLSLMFDTVQRFKDSGWLGVVGANPGVSRLLEITGLVDHPRFSLFVDQTAASAALGATDST
jgi:anti-anti-sigma factor